VNTIHFESDWGLLLSKRFKQAFFYTLAFVVVVIVVAEIKNSFATPLPNLLAIGLGAIVVSCIVGAWVALTGIAIIRFDDLGIHFVTILKHKLSWGKEKSIHYGECKVVEAYYWKFMNHYFLRFYYKEHIVVVLGASEWKRHYDDIKTELRRRLQARQLSFCE
jgi:hypothetical protein